MFVRCDSATVLLALPLFLSLTLSCRAPRCAGDSIEWERLFLHLCLLRYSIQLLFVNFFPVCVCEHFRMYRTFAVEVRVRATVFTRTASFHIIYISYWQSVFVSFSLVFELVNNCCLHTNDSNLGEIIFCDMTFEMCFWYAVCWRYIGNFVQFHLWMECDSQRR